MLHLKKFNTSTNPVFQRLINTFVHLHRKLVYSTTKCSEVWSQNKPLTYWMYVPACQYFKFVIVIPSLATRASAWLRSHRGRPSTGEGRIQAQPASGYRQISVLSLRQVRIKGESGCTFYHRGWFMIGSALWISATMLMAIWRQSAVKKKPHKNHNLNWKNVIKYILLLVAHMINNTSLCQ